MSLTNNEVKFLVTLDINEEVSKKKINAFLDKTIKERKLTFNVAVKDSNKNIKAFMDKNKEKKSNIVFNVATGLSNSNISTYLRNRKQDTQSLVFYVNESATKSKVNSVLSKIEFQPVLISLDANKYESTRRLNKFINDVKLKKKHIELLVAKKDSTKNIDTAINGFNFTKGKIKLDLAKGAFSQINEMLAKKEFTGGTAIVRLDETKTLAEITRQISKMKLPKFQTEVIVTPVATKQTQKGGTKSTTAPTANEVQYSGEKGNVYKKIKEEYKALGQTVELFNKSRSEGENAFINRLKKQGKQVEIIRNAQTQEITKITSTYKNSSNELQKDVFLPFKKEFENTGKSAKGAIQEVHGFTKQTEKLKNTETFGLNKEIDEFKKKLVEAKHTATANAKELANFERRATRATSRNEIDKLTQDLQKHQTEIRKQNKLEKEQLGLKSQHEQLVSNLTRIEKMYLRTVNKEQSQNIKTMLNNIKNMKAVSANGQGLYSLSMGDVREAREQIAHTRSAIKKLNADATEATKNSMGIISAMKVAFEKFPIWMMASTAFYGTIGTFREFGSIIIDIDKKMTSLKKVMSPDTDFGAIFESATESASTFGKTISETMDSYNMFAKQGFKGEELETLASAGLVAGNVGDIEAGKASEYLTASLLQWSKESSDAMLVVDGWNEISNNFATTVENLAQGQAKAGATAKALGMDFDQLNAVVGTLNARTKQSGNEIGNFVKSTFSNILSKKGRKTLDGLGVELENDDGSMRDIMAVYKDVAKEYVKLNQADKNSVTLGLAGKYHISRMQTLLDDLGSVKSMYDEMYDTSKNSANSAMEENQKYMQSLEARINLARVEVEKLALAVGEAFMTEGMIQGLQAFRVLAEAVTALVKEVGFLPPAIFLIITSLALLSNRFSDIIGKMSESLGSIGKIKGALSSQSDATRDLSDAISDNSNEQQRNNSDVESNSQTNRDNSVVVSQNTEDTDRNTEAKKKASKAARLASVGFGVLGIASIGLGFALEGLLSWFSKNRIEQEEFDNNIKEQIATFEANEEQVKKLAARYEQLSAIEDKLSPNSEEYAELTLIQNELANLLPQVKMGEDGLGNSILQSAGYVKQKVEMLEKQLEVQKKLNDEESKAKLDESIEKAKENIPNSEKEIEEELAKTGSYIFKFKNASKYANSEGESINLMDELGLKNWSENLKDAETLANAIAKIREMIARKDEFGYSKGYTESMQIMLDEMVKSYTTIENANLGIISSIDVLRDSYTSSIDDMIGNIKGLDDESTEMFKNILSGVMSLSSTDKAFKKIVETTKAASDSGEVGKKSDFINNVTFFDDLISTMEKSTEEDLEKFKVSFQNKFEEIKKEILASSNYKVDSKGYNSLNKTIDNIFNSTLINEEKIRKDSKETGRPIEEVRNWYATHGEGADFVDAAAESLEDYVSNLKELNSVSEKISGVSESQIEETENLISIYEALSNVTNASEREQAELSSTMEKLNSIYPHLTKYGKIRIEAVKAENKANATLLKSYENIAEGHYDSEQKRTYYSALESNRRLDILKQEIEAIYKAQSSYYDEYERIMSKYEQYGSQGTDGSNPEGITRSEQTALMQYSQTRGEYVGYSDYEEKRSEIEAIQSEISDTANILDNYNTVIEENSENNSENAKETSELEKVTEKYANTLNKLKTSLAAIEAKKKKYPTYSKEYRKALEEENKLLEQQINLNNSKSSDLSSISPTSTSTSTSKDSDNSSIISNLSGWNNKITSEYGASESFRKGKKHTGIDIDGYLGERLDSIVNGKVVSKGYTDLSGNYVVVMDSSERKHFFGHLQDIAVNMNQIVSIGDKIGSIGNTGNVVKGSGDGSHLHYEVKLNGKNIDPTQFVKGAQGKVSIPSKSSYSGGSDTQSTVWNHFKSKGLSDNAVAGIMGNIQQESGFNPKSVNKSSGASGLFQWLGSRKTDLIEYADSLGIKWSDLQTQLDFAWKELTGKENKSLISLQKNMSETEHASEFDRLFERSGRSAVEKRKSHASEYLNRFSGTSGSSNASSKTSSDDSNKDYNDVLNQIEDIKRENAELEQKIQENFYKGIQSNIESFQRNVDYESKIQEKEGTKQVDLENYTKAYEDSVNKQFTAEQRKHKLYKDEQKYIQDTLKLGGLELYQIDELKDRQIELNNLILTSTNEQKAYFSDVVTGRITRFDKQMEKFSDTLTWEELKIQSVDRASSRYNATLNIMNKARGNQVSTIEKELAYIDKMLESNMLTSELYTELSTKAKEYKNTLLELAEAIHQTNYETVMTNVSLADEDIDDLDFEMDLSKTYASMYDEGSADQKRELDFQLTKLEEKLERIGKKGRDIQEDMKFKDLGHKELQDLEEQLEDNAAAYLEVRSSIISTKKELEEFNKIIDEKIEDAYSEIADDIIDTLKDAYNELKDIEMKRLDDLVEAENKRHDKVMKQYGDELDAYTKIIEEKRRAMDDEDKERTHNNNLTDLQNQRQDAQSKLNLLSNVNTYEGKKEREELQQQISELDKQIVEENYQYEKDLRGQQLDDLLDEKTDHIRKLEEKENKHHTEVTEKLDKEKLYYEKYYEDLLNDEREFERLRKEMLKGNFVEIQELFDEHAATLKASLPDLAVSFKGMSETVGTHIRENVIYELENVLKKVQEAKDEVDKLNKLKTVSNEHGSSYESKPNASINNDKDKISEANLKVILAKFMNEQIAGKLDSKKDSSRIKNIKEKASILAKEGRDDGSTIGETQSLGNIFDSLNEDQIVQVGNYFSSNSSESGFSTQEYINYINEFGKTAQGGGLLSSGDKKVLLAKYVRENIMTKAKDKATKDALKAETDTLAQSGRGNLSLISPSTSYDSQIKNLSKQQREELGRYMLSNSSIVSDGFLRSELEEYAENLKLAHDDQYVKLNTGGMIKAIGSTGGMDGAGGKMALLHQNEIVLNPVDTKRILQISSIMENIMRNIGNFISLPKLTKPNTNAPAANSDYSTHVNITVERLNGTQSDIDKLAKQIQNKLLREKGKR